MINTQEVVGDSCRLVLHTVDFNDDPLEFESGAFRSSPEERRVAVIFLLAEGSTKVVKLRFEFTSGTFTEHSITGVPVVLNSPDATVSRSLT